MDSEIMTLREVATYLKIKEKTAYRLAAEGRISWLQGRRLVAVP